MGYPTYLVHYNKNHDKLGRFGSGDGDGDGIVDDNHNQRKPTTNKAGRSASKKAAGSPSPGKQQIQSGVKKIVKGEILSTAMLLTGYVGLVSASAISSPAVAAAAAVGSAALMSGGSLGYELSYGISGIKDIVRGAKAVNRENQKRNSKE